MPAEIYKDITGILKKIAIFFSAKVNIKFFPAKLRTSRQILTIPSSVLFNEL